MADKPKYTIEEITGRQPNPIAAIMVTIGLLLVVAGTMMPIIYQFLDLEIGDSFRYIYSAGAVILLAGRLFSPYTGKAIRVKRLKRIEAWTPIFFCVAAFFLFYPGGTIVDWLAFTLAGGSIQIYASLMLPYAMKKAQKEVK